MSALLFSPLTIKNVTFKNRIAMAPMCMYSSFSEDGHTSHWHQHHYESRAAGQVGLVMIEATTVMANGAISPQDLGIYSSDHIEGLKNLTDGIHNHGAKAGIQLAHAGRKANYDGRIMAPSAIAFDEENRIPDEMTANDIQELIQYFKKAAERARIAGFDVIELHGAHGYLINQFLSPLSNHRTDDYGGTKENRFRLLKEITEAVTVVWDGPLFVRLSADEYHPEGNQPEDLIEYGRLLKELGVDLIDCSSGGVVRTAIETYPGYQISYAENMRKKAGLLTGAVGLITNPHMAEEIIHNGRADMILIGRELLRNPYWPLEAAKSLGAKEVEPPRQYLAGWM
ncbi:NADPH dehydrogenase NamA [Salisediminibacterium beveridgei]|uniref:NADPH dehydrogenase n=1 Tax=Salisediminibacterium beveridgei TaxID=632773 RepID=A0A1D7QUQ8_9BACI|nr:NADPH dehydrogenase NamA [Salisediminibacterium beveridgei]AOM82708.1 NADPH dehydrogenase [Salisediminibacterium beveridgei]